MSYSVAGYQLGVMICPSNETEEGIKEVFTRLSGLYTPDENKIDFHLELEGCGLVASTLSDHVELVSQWLHEDAIWRRTPAIVDEHGKDIRLDSHFRMADFYSFNFQKIFEQEVDMSKALLLLKEKIENLGLSVNQIGQITPYDEKPFNLSAMTVELNT